MNRGVLELTKEEVNELNKVISLEKFSLASENDEAEKKIFVNEEELEGILDEIGLINDNEIIASVKEKVYELLKRFRGL